MLLFYKPCHTTSLNSIFSKGEISAN